MQGELFQTDNNTTAQTIGILICFNEITVLACLSARRAKTLRSWSDTVFVFPVIQWNIIEWGRVPASQKNIVFIHQVKYCSTCSGSEG